MNPFGQVDISIRVKGSSPQNAALINPTWLRLQRLALHWDFLMRNRSRWIEDEELRDKIAQRSRDHLNAIGVHESFLVTLARAGQVEVSYNAGPGYVSSVEDKSTQQGLPTFFGVIPLLASLGGVLSGVFARIFDQNGRRMPWESLLTMAARKYQNHERFVVYRRLLGLPAQAETAAPEVPVKALFVESAPGRLMPVYNFDKEYLAVQSYLGGVELSRLRHPSLNQLKTYVGDEKNRPSIIHLTGIDGYQGFQLLEKVGLNGTAAAAKAEPGQEPARPQEGVYFRDDSGIPKIETPEAIAGSLCANGHRPLLVTFNLYNSSARLAAEVVKSGARAAIGFQDFIDDTVAEIFFANLFFAWSNKPGTPLLEAFDRAVRGLDSYSGKIRGSGVTLWTREPLLDASADGALCLPPSGAKEKRRSTGPRPDAVLQFDVQPFPALNYSVLHNGKRQMFSAFRVYKFSPGPLKDLRVEVNLGMGAENFGFRGTFTMEDHILDLAEGIAVGLTSSLSRSLRESVRTTVFVRVTVGPDDERFCKTFDVSLLAVDEWKDDPLSGAFLASFVLPRDPVIARVIASAQRYLTALADDFSRGFDGYQSRDDYPDDPAAALEVQARAIWYTLQHDFALKYINPPPTFSEYSQRLRTPSDVLKGGRGTCIDLALVLAACFEYIGLCPVIFLMTGHAFVGYWNDEDRHDEFRTTKDVPLLSKPNDPTPLPTEQERLEAESFLPLVEWQFDERRRQQIVEAVERGDLVALEATYLTNGGGFSDACEVGAANLNNGEEFESMIDITLAREKGVTPLPLVLEEGGR